TATDDTYRWRFAFEEAYDRFWVKGIRYLFEGRLSAGNSRLAVTLGEDKIELGQAVKGTADVRTETFDPWVCDGYTLSIVDADGAAGELPRAPVEGVPGRYEAWLRPTQVGWYRVQPLRPITKGPTVQAALQVVPAALEKEGPVDLEELRAIAGTDEGVVLRADAVEQAVEAIESATRIESFTQARTIWDSWLTVAVLVTVLAAEWWLRKRSNLL